MVIFDEDVHPARARSHRQPGGANARPPVSPMVARAGRGVGPAPQVRPGDALVLQRTVGNAGLNGLLGRPAVVQRKAGPQGQQVGASVELFFAGSGYGKWATHEADQYRKETGKSEPQWQNEGLPSAHYWTSLTQGAGTDPTYYKRSHEGPAGNRTAATKTEYLFAGVGGPGTVAGGIAAAGTQDRGSNTIANVADCAVQLIKAMHPKPAVVTITGHSRGSIAGALAAQRLQKDFKVEVALFDPVPGPMQSANYFKGRLQEDTGAGTGTVESTVVYSIASQYATGFVPMQVLGAKRLILSTQHHSVGVKHGFEYAGNIYTGSGLNGLPPGIYLDKDTHAASGESGGKTGLASGPAHLEKVDDAVKLKQLQKECDRMRASTGRGLDVNPDELGVTRRGQIHRVLTEYYERRKPPKKKFLGIF